MSSSDDYKAKLRDIIESECDGSRMNNTKWLEMLDALQGLALNTRIKILQSPKITDWGGVNIMSRTPVSAWIEGSGYSPVPPVGCRVDGNQILFNIES